MGSNRVSISRVRVFYQESAAEPQDQDVWDSSDGSLSHGGGEARGSPSAFLIPPNSEKATQQSYILDSSTYPLVDPTYEGMQLEKRHLRVRTGMANKEQIPLLFWLTKMDTPVGPSGLVASTCGAIGLANHQAGR